LNFANLTLGKVFLWR